MTYLPKKKSLSALSAGYEFQQPLYLEVGLVQA